MLIPLTFASLLAGTAYANSPLLGPPVKELDDIAKAIQSDMRARMPLGTFLNLTTAPFTEVNKVEMPLAHSLSDCINRNTGKCSKLYAWERLTLNQIRNVTINYRTNVDNETPAGSSPATMKLGKTTAITDARTTGWKIAVKAAGKLGFSSPSPAKPAEPAAPAAVAARGKRGEVGFEVTYEYSDQYTKSETITTTTERTFQCPAHTTCSYMTLTFSATFIGSCKRVPWVECGTAYNACHDFKTDSDGKLAWTKDMCFASFAQEYCRAPPIYPVVDECQVTAPVLDKDGKPLTGEVFVEMPHDRSKPDHVTPLYLHSY